MWALIILRGFLTLWLVASVATIIVCVVSSGDVYNKTFSEAFAEKRKIIVMVLGAPIFLPLFIFKYITKDLLSDIKWVLDIKEEKDEEVDEDSKYIKFE